MLETLLKRLGRENGGAQHPAGSLLPYLLSPSSIENEGPQLRAGEYLHRVLSVVGIPRLVRAGFLNPLLLSQGEFDVSLHLAPKPTEYTVTQLNQELVKLASDLHAMEAKGEIVPPSLRLKYDDTLRVLSALQSGEEQLFDLSFYVNVRGRTMEQLEENTSRMTATLSQLSLLYKHLDFRLHDALPSIMPLATDCLRMRRSMTSSALAACFPFTSSNLQAMEKGIVVGANDLTGIPLILDFFQLQNPNLLILGSSGSGKSFAAKTILLRLNRAGTKAYVIDPQGEYRKLACKLGQASQIISFSPEEGNNINPFDCRGLSLAEKVQSLTGLFAVMAGGELSPAQKSFLDEALYAIYEQRGISDASPQALQKPPAFSDLYRFAKSRSEERGATPTARATALALANRLRPYTRGSLKCFDRATNVNLKAEFIVFDVSYFVDKMQTVAPPAMYILLDFLFQQMKEEPLERKAVVVDEAWRLLRNDQASEYLLLFAKTARKYNTSLQIISQELGDLSQSEAGASVLANTALKLILRQDPTEIEAVAAALKLGPNDKNRLLTAASGHGILIAENSRVPYYSLHAPEELAFLSTKAEELRQIGKTPGPKKPEEESGRVLDFQKGCYRQDGLSESQKIVLLKNGFTVASAYDLLEKRPCNFIVKRRHPESLQHTILVAQLESLLREYTQDVRVNTNNDADIVFTDKLGRKIALEVETGLNNHISAKVMAVRSRNYDETHFVLANALLSEAYKPYGRILTRSRAEQFIREKME
ncbi:ATP-binding protein [Candidatus Micrarchaeota archaeon]|nr:ATP-binding protein [Candidatus Micrarchaeota archaeon]